MKLKENAQNTDYLRTQEGALRYICEKKYGLLSELKDEIGDELFERFMRVGFIAGGVTPCKNQGYELRGTWKDTALAKRELYIYYPDIYQVIN